MDEGFASGEGARIRYATYGAGPPVGAGYRCILIDSRGHGGSTRDGRDEFIKRDHAEYLARTIPGARLVVLGGVSHFAPLQSPSLFNEAVLAFLSLIREGGPNHPGT